MLSKLSIALVATLGSSTTLDREEVMNNMRPGLLPPEGKVWRGSTIPKEHGALWSGVDPHIFEDRYGQPLSIYKSYRNKWNPEISEAEVKFIEEGNILKYSVQPDKWKSFADGEKDDEIISYA